MSKDFYLKVYCEARKCPDADAKEDAIGLYKTSPTPTWDLQVRTDLRRANGTRGADFVIAMASLSIDSLKALRDAIDEELKITRS